MITVIVIIAAIIASVLLVYLTDNKLSSKYKPFVLLGLWTLVIFLSYNTFMSVYGEIQFNQIKEKRYKIAIENLIDIRDSQLAHRAVKGKFESNWDSLVKFIDSAQFTITQRRDSTIIDKELSRLYGVDTTKDIVIVDTLGFVSVKDSLFGVDDRYKTMMNIPVGKEGQVFELKAGFLDQNGVQIAVFEASADKALILHDQQENLIKQEKEVASVEAVNGPTIKVGSMDEVNTNGNWPKNYSKQQ
jgi:hypothetical protein